MSNPLNPELYGALRRVFGDVRIASEGEPAVVYYPLNPLSGKKEMRFRPGGRGEQYRVDCPGCGDRYKRLYVSHLWGQRDKYTKRRMYGLLNCRNEDCFRKDGYHLHSFMEKLSFGIRSEATVREPEEGVDPEPTKTDWPGEMQPMASLPGDHAARIYLEERLGGPQLYKLICGFYDVRLCTGTSRPKYRRILEGRIVVPIVFKEEMVGWQARYPGDWDKSLGVPKYFTTPNLPAARLFYNYDNARLFKTIVVMEGTTDVWAFGPMGVSLLGKELSLERMKLLSLAKPQHVVLMLDEDALQVDKKGELVDPYRQAMWHELQRNFPKRCCMVRLPKDTDPGDYSANRHFLREYVRGVAREQDLEIDYGLKDT